MFHKHKVLLKLIVFNAEMVKLYFQVIDLLVNIVFKKLTVNLLLVR